MNKNEDKKFNNYIKKSITAFNTDFNSFKIVIIIAAIWLLFSFFTNGVFLSSRNLSTLFRQVTILGIMSIGLMIVLTTGNIDMSIGVITGYTSIFAASFSILISNNLSKWYPTLNMHISVFGIDTTANGLLSTFISFMFCILLGAVIGFFQGSLTAYFGIPSLIATIGTSSVLIGLIAFASLGVKQLIFEKTFLYLGQGYASKSFGIIFVVVFILAIFYYTIWNRKQNKIYSIKQSPLYIDLIKFFIISIMFIGYVLYVANGYLGFQIPVLIMAIMALLFSYILSSTRFGRYLYAIGGNKGTAAFSGVNVRKNILLSFVLCGIICSIAGFILSAYMGTGSFGEGPVLSFEVIIACLIGLIAFKDKNGVIVGIIGGALIIGSIDCFMVLLDFQPFIKYIIKGLFLVIVAYIAKEKELIFKNYLSNTLPPFTFRISIKGMIKLIPGLFDLNGQTYPSAISFQSKSHEQLPVFHIKRIKNILKNPKFLWCIILIIAAVFYFTGISHESLWCDEAFSANMTDYSFFKILKTTSLDVHPPLYYIMLKIFRIVLGKSEFAFRLLSVLGAVGMICLGVGPVTRLFGNRTAITYAVITVFTPITLIMAHEARMYSLAMFTVTACALYGLLVIKENKKCDWIKYGILMLTSAYLHYFALLAVFFINIFLLTWIVFKKRELLKRYIITSGIVVLTYLPWLFFFIGQIKKVNNAFWVMPFHFFTVLLSFLQSFYYKNFFPFEGVIFFMGLLTLILVALTVVIALINTLIKKEKQKFTMSFYFIFIYISTILTAILFSITVKPILYPRYMIVCSGLLILLFSIGINNLRYNILRIIIIIFFILLNLTTIKNVYTKQFNGSFREVKNQLNDSIKPGDLVITSDCYCVSPAIYYLPDADNFLYVNSLEKNWEFTFDAMRPHLVEESNVNNLLKKYKSFWIIKSGTGLSVDAEEILKDIPGWEAVTEEIEYYYPYSLTRFLIKKYAYTGKVNTHETSGDLILNINNIKKIDSRLIISIYNKDFKDEPRRSYKADIIRVNTGELNYVFHNIKYGEYAAVVLHDENNNHNFDVNIHGVPKEGYKIYNFDPLLERDIIFNKIKFEFKRHNQKIGIKMEYPINN